VAFDAGAVKGKLIFDTSQWDAGEQKVSGDLDGFGKKGDLIGKALKAGFDLTVQGLEASTIASEEFNKAFANVSTLVDTATVDMGAMQTELLALDNRLGSATELTDGLYQAISASVEPAKAVRFVGEAAKFARAGLTSTNKAVDVITTSLNAYGLSADEAGKVSDTLFTTIRLGKTTGDQLARSIGKSIPLAANAGVSFEELNASLAVMTRQGVTTAQSTTQVNSVISSLIKPSKAASLAFEKMGYDSAGAAIEALGLQGTLKGLIGTTDGSNESVAQLFPNIRALRGTLALTGAGASDFDEVLQQMNDSAGATETAFGKQELTMDTFDNTVNKLAITLGNELLPFVHSVVAEFTGFIDSITRSGELANFLGEAVSFASGAFTLLTSALEPVINDLLVKGQEEFDDIAENIAGTAGETEKALVPFQIFAKSLAVLSDVATVLIKGFGLLATSIINVLDIAGKAATVFQEIGKFLSFQESDIGGAFNKLGDSFGKAVDDFADNAVELGTAAADTIGGLFEDVTDKALDFQKKFNEGVEKTKNTIELASETFDKNTDAIEANTDAIEEVSEALIVNNDLEWQAALASIENTAAAMAEKRALDAKIASLSGLNNSYERNLKLLTETEKKNIKAKEQADALKDSFDDAAKSVISLGEKVSQDLTSGLFDVGAAFGSGADAGASFSEAIKNIGLSILEALPSLLLQAGLTILPTNIPLGLGLIAAAGVVAIGAGAIAGVLGLDVPEKAEGGQASGLTLVGERGPELVDFRSPAQVFSNEDSREILGGGDIIINFNGPLNSELDLKRAGEYLGRELQARRTAI
jgi:TP901 family phage tail tape measure protein